MTEDCPDCDRVTVTITTELVSSLDVVLLDWPLLVVCEPCPWLLVGPGVVLLGLLWSSLVLPLLDPGELDVFGTELVVGPEVGEGLLEGDLDDEEGPSLLLEPPSLVELGPSSLLVVHVKGVEVTPPDDPLSDAVLLLLLFPLPLPPPLLF